jgi:ligand-binding sensor domain-containing protein/signal transduction histidine kinase
MCLVSAALALDPTRRVSQYVHDKWGYDRGFVGGSIYAIRQSADGYLWIGTERGLVRFDGFSFTLIQTPMPDGLSIGPVRGLVSDSRGNLWIRLEGPRIIFYHDGQFEDSYSSLDLQGITFTATATDYDGGVFLSGLGDKTLRYKGGRLEAIVSAEENPGTVISMAATQDESVWLGTQDNGLFRVREGRISRVAQELKDLKINCLLPADTGGLWIGTDHGIHLWEGGALVTVALPSSLGQLQILTMVRDRDANVWIGTNHGIVRMTRSGSVSLEQLSSKPGSEVTAIYEDSDGDIWFGGSRGVERLRNGMFTTFSTTDGLPSGGYGAIYADSTGRTWIAPLSGGLYWVRNGEVGHITLDGIEHDVVYSIGGGEREIWVGRQRGGLTVLSGEGDKFTAHTYTQADGLVQNSVYSVNRDRGGRIWAGTISGGVSRLNDGRFTNYSTANGLVSDSVNAIVEGFDGTTWFATSGGLAAFSNGRWTSYTIRDGLPSLTVRTIFQDTKHVLWIATAGGLAYLSSGQIKVPPGLPNPLREQVFGVAEDGMGTLWFTTSDHVLRVNRDRLLSGSLADTDVQSYGIEDGLPGVEGVARDRTVVADRMGRIWLSLASSLCLADPIVASRNAIPATVRIESILVGGHEVSSQKPVKVPAGVRSIGFTFGATNLAVPTRIRFRYKLDGSAQDWSNIVATKQVVFSNLGPGNYEFRIVASNSVGLWNGPETSVRFVIEPSFWQTWWFRIGCVTACCLLIMAFYRLRMSQVTRQLNVRFQDRLAERTRIAQELHDTLLQGVFSASMQLDVVEDQTPHDSPTKPLLRRVLQLMNQVTEEGRNALRGLRVPAGESLSLETALSRIREEFAFDQVAAYRVVVHGDALPLNPIIRDEAYRIGREAVVNAFLHAQANNIEVKVEYVHRYFRILVSDDGRGMDPHVLETGREGHWGLPGMRERSENISARLRLRSRIGAGTEVELTIPSAIAFESQPRGWLSRWVPWLTRGRFDTHSKGIQKGEKR